LRKLVCSKMGHISLRIAFAAAALAAIAGCVPSLRAQTSTSSLAPKSAAANVAPCDRACLEAITLRYLEAMVAHDPTHAPLSPSVKFTQDNVPLQIGDALWGTMSAIGTYRHFFADPERGDVGCICVVYENDVAGILIVRLKVENHTITEAEQFFAHDPHGAAAYEKAGKPKPLWLQPIPPALRQTREALEQAAYMYYEAIAKNDGRGVYAFTGDCERTEDGVYTTNQPRPQNYGHSDTDISDFTMMPCKKQYELGFLGFTTGCRDRRYLVVDIERGAILASAFLDFDGTVTEMRLTDGRVWKVPPYFMTPRTNMSNEAYRVENGTIRLIEMTMYEVPFNITSPYVKP
jgi:hypothetical protein